MLGFDWAEPEYMGSAQVRPRSAWTEPMVKQDRALPLGQVVIPKPNVVLSPTLRGPAMSLMARAEPGPAHSGLGRNCWLGSGPGQTTRGLDR